MPPASRHFPLSGLSNQHWEWVDWSIISESGKGKTWTLFGKWKKQQQQQQQQQQEEQEQEQEEKQKDNSPVYCLLLFKIQDAIAKDPLLV